jgi:hypothetical protein
MLKNIIRLAAAALIVNGLLFIGTKMFVLDKFAASARQAVSASGAGGGESINELLARTVKMLKARQAAPAIDGVEFTAPENKVEETATEPARFSISGGVIEGPQTLAVPVWISENRRFLLAKDPVFIMVSGINSSGALSASIEIEGPGGEKYVFNGVKKGETMRFGKYTALLVDLKADKPGAWPRPGNNARVALYFETPRKGVSGGIFKGRKS